MNQQSVPKIIDNHKNNKLLSEREFLLAKTNDVGDLNFVIQYQHRTFTTEGWLSRHHASKCKPIKTIQWNTFGDDSHFSSRDDTRRRIWK